jgi:hypothetical protein
MSIIRQALKKHKRQSRPPWGKVAPTGDGRGKLALKPRLPHNQRTYPRDCKAGAQKSRPPWGKVAPTGDGRGELALNPRLPHSQRTHPSDCEAGARKSRPPWGKVAGECLTEGGNSLSNQDCPTTNAPTPTTAVQKNSTKSERPYNPASEIPPTEP